MITSSVWAAPEAVPASRAIPFIHGWAQPWCAPTHPTPSLWALVVDISDGRLFQREKGLVLHVGYCGKGKSMCWAGQNSSHSVMLNVPPWTQCWCDRYHHGWAVTRTALMAPCAISHGQRRSIAITITKVIRSSETQHSP